MSTFNDFYFILKQMKGFIAKEESERVQSHQEGPAIHRRVEPTQVAGKITGN